MRILFVAMSNSVHTVRWINQLSDQNWDVHLYPSTDVGIVDPKLENLTVYSLFYSSDEKISKKVNPTIKQKGFYISRLLFGLHRIAKRYIRIGLNRYLPNYQVYHLRSLIKKLNPDIIHSLELQNGGYLTYKALYQNLAELNFSNVIKRLTKNSLFFLQQANNTDNDFAKQRIVGNSAKWILTTWGSDLYLFGRLEKHRGIIQQVLGAIDFLSCDCKRDYSNARSLGYDKDIIPTPSVTGGFNFDKLIKLRQAGLTSDRRIIMLKGYQNWSGRALVGLRALELCADLLTDYTIVIYLCDESLKIPVKLFSLATGIPVKILEFDPNDHDKILRYHGQARISMGLGISDGFSVSLLEAAAMGSFPIQSNTSAANEIVIAGKTAFFVPPNDPEIVEKAIRQALLDDELVNFAAEENWKIMNNTFDMTQQKVEAINYYKDLMSKCYI